MSSNTDPDRQFRQFLQAYRPPVPPVPPDLEAQLFQQIHSPPSTVMAARHLKKDNRRWRRLSTGLVVIGMAIGGGVAWRWQTQTALAPTPPDVLEAFLEDSWTGAIAVPEEAEWVEVQTDLSSPSQEWWQLTQSAALHPAK